jgi:hypothetical protein
VKKPKSKTKSAKTPAVKLKELESGAARIAELQKHKYAKIRPLVTSGWLPTPEQIATIAATLVCNQYDASAALVGGFKTKTLEASADVAMRLWLAARKRIIIADCCAELHLSDRQLYKDFFPHGEPLFDAKTTEFPLTRDKFFQILLPHLKSRPELTRIGKAFVAYLLRQKNKKEPTPDEIIEGYRFWPSLHSDDRLEELGRSFIKWHRETVKESRRAAGKISASKKKMKKKL